MIKKENFLLKKEDQEENLDRLKRIEVKRMSSLLIYRKNASRKSSRKRKMMPRRLSF